MPVDRWVWIVGGVGTAVDFGAAVATTLGATATRRSGWWSPAEWGAPFAAMDRECSDLLLLLALRLAMFALCVVLTKLHHRRLSAAAPDDKDKGPDAARDHSVETAASLATVRPSSTSERTPLLSVNDETAAINDNDEASPAPRTAPRPATPRAATAETADAVFLAGVRAKAVHRKQFKKTEYAAAGAIFVGFAACNIYTAVKALGFDVVGAFGHDYLGGLGFGATVFAINAELFAGITTLRQMARGDGEPDLEDKALHPHPMAMNLDVAATKCNVCALRVKRECFTCEDCDYDVCVDCYKKKRSKRPGGSATPPAPQATQTAGAEHPGTGAVAIADPAAERQARAAAKAAEHAAINASAPLSKPQFLLRTVKLMSSFLPTVCGALLCLVVCQGARLFLPHFQGHVVDAVVGRDTSRFTNAVAWYAGLSAALTLVGSLQAFCTLMVWRYAGNAVRCAVFAATIRRDVAFFDGATVGSLTSRMTNDARAMVSPISTLLNQVLSNIILLLGGLVMSIYVCWKLALLALTVIGPIVVVTDFYGRFATKMQKRIFDSLADANNIATQAFTNIRTVRAFAAERSERSKFDASMDEALGRGRTVAAANAGNAALTNFLELGSMCLILGFGGAMAINHPEELSIGRLVTFQLYANMMATAYRGLNGVLTKVTQAAGAAERIFQMIDATSTIPCDTGDDREPLLDKIEYNGKPADAARRRESGVTPGVSPMGSPEPTGVAEESCDPSPAHSPRSPTGRGGHAHSPLPIATFEGAVEFRDVHFAYASRANHLVLRGLTLQCPPGKVTAVVGASGGGKTTLMHLLMRFYDPDEGSVVIDGVDLRALNPGWVRRHSAVVAQDTQLFDSTIAENIVYGMPDADDGRPVVSHGDDADGHVGGVPMADIVEAATRANADGFIRTLEDGYHTKVGERGLRLSGGQRQRVAIARAFLRRPRLLLLDEATSALDAESEAQVQGALDDLMRTQQAARCTVLVVAHRLSTVVNADQIAVVHDGRIGELGTHRELLARTPPPEGEAGAQHGGLYRMFVARATAAMEADKKAPSSDGAADINQPAAVTAPEKPPRNATPTGN